MCNHPCRAHTRLQAGTVSQARNRLRETPATPCSALTQWVTLIEGKKINVHKASQAKVSGQLPFLGSTK